MVLRISLPQGCSYVGAAARIRANADALAELLTCYLMSLAIKIQPKPAVPWLVRIPVKDMEYQSHTFKRYALLPSLDPRDSNMQKVHNARSRNTDIVCNEKRAVGINQRPLICRGYRRMVVARLNAKVRIYHRGVVIK